MARSDDREVVFVEREDGSGALKWLLVGAVMGAGLALLFAPRSGKDLRSELRRGARRVRNLATDAVDELKETFGGAGEGTRARAMADTGGAYHEDEELEEEAEPEERGGRSGKAERPGLRGAREELERRLEAARARRRQPVPDDEEPVA